MCSLQDTSSRYVANDVTKGREYYFLKNSRKMSISFLGKVGSYFNAGISFMGTSAHLHDLCSLWSFFCVCVCDVNMERILPGDLCCVPKNAATGVS